MEKLSNLLIKIRGQITGIHWASPHKRTLTNRNQFKCNTLILPTHLHINYGGEAKFIVTQRLTSSVGQMKSKRDSHTQLTHFASMPLNVVVVDAMWQITKLTTSLKSIWILALCGRVHRHYYRQVHTNTQRKRPLLIINKRNEMKRTAPNRKIDSLNAPCCRLNGF